MPEVNGVRFARLWTGAFASWWEVVVLPHVRFMCRLAGKNGILTRRSCCEHIVGRWTAARTMTTSLWRPHRQHDIVSVMFLKACMGNWGRMQAYATSPKVWNPELEGLELKGLHLQALFDGLDSRTECSFFAKRQGYDSDAHLRSAGLQRWSSVRQPSDKQSHCCLLPAKQQAVQLISWAEEPTQTPTAMESSQPQNCTLVDPGAATFSHEEVDATVPCLQCTFLCPDMWTSLGITGIIL